MPSLPVATTTTLPAAIAASTALCMIIRAGGTAAQTKVDHPRRRRIGRHPRHWQPCRPANRLGNVRQRATAFAEGAHRKNSDVPTNAGDTARVVRPSPRPRRPHGAVPTAGVIWRCLIGTPSVALVGYSAFFCRRNPITRIGRVCIAPVAIIGNKVGRQGRARQRSRGDEVIARRESGRSGRTLR